MGASSTRDDRTDNETPAAKRPAEVRPRKARSERIRPEKIRPENLPADEVARASSTPSGPPPPSPPPPEPPTGEHAPDLLRLQVSSARLAEVGILAIRGPVERSHRYVLREVFD